MSGSGKDVSGMVGISRDEVRAGTFPDIEGISFKHCTTMQTLNMGQVLRHTDPELGIGQHGESPVEAELWNPDLPVLMQFGCLEGIAKLNKTASSHPVLLQLWISLLLQFCSSFVTVNTPNRGVHGSQN